MTTILILNAISSGLATVGFGALLVRKRRQARHRARLQPVYVSAAPKARRR